jgi:D-alanyl-D-alanine carboxypeptidase
MPRMTRLVPRCFIVLVLVSVLFLISATSANAADPVDVRNRPKPLAGAVNGRVPPNRLINVAPHCITARAAGPSLARIFATALQAKVSLGAEQCYRGLAEQVSLAGIANQPGNNPACVASVSRDASGAPVGNSYHGWGKAVDLVDAAGSLTFSSVGFGFMTRVAGSVGWNHPAFARPGTACPEPWHWEWVGDGGSLNFSTKRGDAVALLPSTNDRGYAVVTGLGAVHGHGNFVRRGAADGIPLAWVIVGAGSTPGRGGYWLVGADGGVFTFGNARFYGSTGRLRLVAPVHTIVPTPNGKGYWLAAWDGGVFSFGNARFHGSTGGKALAAPVDGMVATRRGNGYWLVASDGGVFSFGDAKFHGSMGGRRLASPVVGMTRTPSGKGYWLYASDGGVFTFGDAKFRGSLGGSAPGSPIVSMRATTTGRGYWLLRADGSVAAFGDARHFGNG